MTHEARNHVPDIPGYPTIYTGKVRSLLRLNPTHTLMVATDRISAFDVTFSEGIPDKGRVLNQLAAWWFARTKHIVPNHLVDTSLDGLPSELHQFAGRAMICRMAKKVVKAECIVRGNIDGSAWKEYQITGRFLDHKLPAGLKRYDPLPAPIFTPSTKADLGDHDENITFDRMVEVLDGDRALAERVRDISLALYNFANEVLLPLGIRLADTKFEFGLDAEGNLFLIDEALTPDSSRYYLIGEVGLDGAPVILDKQILRDWVTTHCRNWNKKAPAPTLPPEVIAQISAKYRELYHRITGLPLAHK